jgi:ribosomal protein S27E
MTEENNIKKKRKYEKRSLWWSYFEETVKGEEAECKCEGCEHKKVVFDGSTTALKKHIERHHKTILEENEKLKSKMIDRTFSNFEKKEISKYTVLMIIMENRPFSMIQGEWYKTMMSKIQQNWIPTDHKTFDLYINEIYEEIHTNVKKELKKQIFFCQTSDGWKSLANDNYYSINLHYINEDWEYVTINLGTISIEEEHITGEVIMKNYKKLYRDFEIEETEIVEVIDGGSNLQKAAELLKHKSLHCNIVTIMLYNFL